MPDDDKKQAGDPAGDDKDKGKSESDKTQDSGEKGKVFTQDDVNRIVQERLEKEKKKAETAAAAAAEQAEKAKLEAAQEWESLAKKAEAKVKALEAQVTELQAASDQVAGYEAAITKVLAGQREGLPVHITALLDKLSPLDQLDYLAENAKNLQPQQKTKVPATPNAADPDSLTDAQKAELNQVSDSFYRNLW